MLRVKRNLVGDMFYVVNITGPGIEDYEIHSVHYNMESAVSKAKEANDNDDNKAIEILNGGKK